MKRLLNMADMIGRTIRAVDETDAFDTVLVTFTDDTWLSLTPRDCGEDNWTIYTDRPQEHISHVALERLGIAPKPAAPPLAGGAGE